MAQIPSVFNASQYFGNTSAKKGQQDSFFDHQSANTNPSTARFQDPFQRNFPTAADSSMSDFQDDFDRWDAWPSQEDQFLGSNAGYQNKIDTFYNTGTGPRDDFGYQQSELLVTDNNYSYHEDLSAERNSSTALPPPHVEPAMDSWKEQKEAHPHLGSAYYSTQASSNTSAARFFDQNFIEGSNNQPPYSNAEMKPVSQPHQSFVFNQSSFPDLQSAFSAESRPVMTSNHNEQQDSRFLNDHSGKSYASVCQPSPPAESSQHDDSMLENWGQAPHLESSYKESSQHFSSEFPHFQQSEQKVDSWSREPDVGSWSPVFSHGSSTISNAQQMGAGPSETHMEEARGTNPLQTFQNDEELDTYFHKELPPYSQHGPLTTGNQKERTPTAPYGQLPPDDQLEAPHPMLQTGLEGEQMQAVSHAQVFHPFEQSQTATCSDEMYQSSGGSPASFHHEVHHPLIEAEELSVDERGREEGERQDSPHTEMYQPFEISPASLYQEMPHPTSQGEHLIDEKGRQLEDMQASQPQAFQPHRELPSGLHQEVVYLTSQTELPVAKIDKETDEFQSSPHSQVFSSFGGYPTSFHQDALDSVPQEGVTMEKGGQEADQMQAPRTQVPPHFATSPARFNQGMPQPTLEGDKSIQSSEHSQVFPEAQMLQPLRKSPASGFHQEVSHPSPQGELAADIRDKGSLHMQAPPPAQILQPSEGSPASFNQEVTNPMSVANLFENNRHTWPQEIQVAPQVQMLQPFENPAADFHQEVPHPIPQREQAVDDRSKETSQIQDPLLAQISQPSVGLPGSFTRDITLPTPQGMLCVDETQTSSPAQTFQPFGGLPAGFQPPYSTMQDGVGTGNREQEQQMGNTPQVFQPTQVASTVIQNGDLSKQEVSSPVTPVTNNLLVEPESPQDAVQAAFQQKKLAGKEPAASPRTSLWTNGASLLAPCMLAPAAAVRSSDHDDEEQGQPIVDDKQQQMEGKYVPLPPVPHQGAVLSNVFKQSEPRTVQPIHGRLTEAPAPVSLGLTTVQSSLPSLACEPVDAVLKSEFDVAPQVDNLPHVDSTPVHPPQHDVTTQLGNFDFVGNKPGNPVLQPQEDVSPQITNSPHRDAFPSNIERDCQKTSKAPSSLQTSQPTVVPQRSAREAADNLLPATSPAERGVDYNLNQLQHGQNQHAVEEHNQPKQRTASLVDWPQSKPEHNASLASILQGGGARHKKKQSISDSRTPSYVNSELSMNVSSPQVAVAPLNTDTLLSHGDFSSEQDQGVGLLQNSGHKVEDNSLGNHERGVDDPHLGEYSRRREESYYGKDMRDNDWENYDRTGSGTRDYDQREHDRKECDGRGFDRREYYKDYNRREYDERDHERREYDKSEYGGNDPDRGEFGRRHYERRDDGRRAFDQKQYEKKDYDRREYVKQDYERRAHDRGGYGGRGHSRREYDRREYDGREDEERDFERREYGKKDYDRRELSGRDYNRRDYHDGREFDRRDFDRKVNYDRQNPYESPSSPSLGRRGHSDRRPSRDDMYGVSDGRDGYYSYHGGRNTPSSGRNSPGQDYAPQSYPPYQYGYPAYSDPNTSYGSTDMYNYLMMLYHYYPQHYEQFIAQQGFYHAGYGSCQQGYSSGYGSGYESFQEVAGVGVAEVEPQRTTPYLFRIQHPIVRFNGGRMVSLIPSDDIDERPSCVVASVQMVFTEREFENIKAFAGPLTRYSSRTEVISYCEARSAERDLSGEGTVKCLLWRVLANLVKHNGAFVTSELAELIMENWRGINHSKENELLSGPERMQLSETESRNHLQVYREMLLAGATKDALEYLMRFQMWGHALMLASKMDKKVHNDIMNRFMRTMGDFDPIRTVYDHLSGRQPAALVATDDWQRHLAAMVANPSRQQPECNKKNIMLLGDTLMADDQVYAAHLCFLLAGVKFGFPSEPNTKVVLLGIDHRKRDLTSQHIPLDNLQMMEILEYATSLSNEEYYIPSLQTYKFLHAMRLCEAGFTEEALHYVEVIGHNIIKHPHHFNETLVKNVKELTDRLNTGSQDATEITEMLEKLLQAKDSTQISSSTSESEDDQLEDQLAESSASFFSGYDPAAQVPQQQELQQQEEVVQPESSWAEPPPAALRSQDSVSESHQDSWATGMAVQSDAGMQYPPSSGPQSSWGEYPPTNDPPSQIPFFSPQQLVSQQIPDQMGGVQPAVEEQPPFIPQPSWGEGYQSSWSAGTTTEGLKTAGAVPPKEDEPVKKVEGKSDKSEKKKKKKKENNNHNNQGGWLSGLSGIFQKVIPRGPNEMILPDDSKKSIYWDEELKRWVDTEEDEKDKAPPPPPPSDLQLIGATPPKMNTVDAPFVGGMTPKAENTGGAYRVSRIPTGDLKLGDGMSSWTPAANGIPLSSGSGGPGVAHSGSPLVPTLPAANQHLNSSAPDSPATVSRFSRKAYGGARLAKKYVDVLNPSGKGTSAMSLPSGLLPMMPSPSTEFKGALFTPAPVSTSGDSTYDQRVDQPAVGNPSSRPSSRTEEEDGGDVNSQHSRSSSASLTSAEVRSYMMPQDPDPPPQDVNSPPPPMFYNPMAFAQPRTPAVSRKPRYPGIRQ